MTSFTEFQELVFGRLSSIEERISEIEQKLGITQDAVSDENKSEEIVVSEPEIVEEKSDCIGLKDEFSDFQRQLSEIKFLFSQSDN